MTRILLPVACAVLISCLPAEDRRPDPAEDGDAGPKTAGVDFSRLKASSWVSIYDPEKAWNGYTLALYRGRIPIVIDMNGRIVHAWHETRFRSRIRLLPDGNLLGIALGNAISEYDWDGRLVWEHRLKNQMPHHDVVRTKNGYTLVVVLVDGEVADDILEVDRRGQEVWRWRAREHLEDYFVRSTNPKDVTHINSVQELPANPWYAAGDERFRPGNLLISARNLNAVFLIDRQSGGIVWAFDEGLDRQHEAWMIDPSLPGSGRILIFDNGRFRTDRRSRVLEVDPRTSSVTWEYRSEGFFSPTSGIEQPLPNGNVMISSSRGGRVFEIDRGGRILWQWTPPFYPKRPRRYGYAYCPQLAALDRPSQRPVSPANGYRWVDLAAYRFAHSQAARHFRWIDGQKRMVLRKSEACDRLFLPMSPSVVVGYGFDLSGIREAGRDDYAARFVIRLRVESSGEEALLLDDTLAASAGGPWYEATLSLKAYGLQSVELCLEAHEAGAHGAPAARGLVWWGQPIIETPIVGRLEQDGFGLDELTPEEKQTREKHLRTLGYVG